MLVWVTAPPLSSPPPGSPSSPLNSLQSLVRSVVLLSASMAARWPSCASLTSELAEDELSTSRKRQKSSTATSNVHKPLHCLSMPHIQVPFPLFYLFLKMVSRHLNALYFPMTPFCPFAFWALMVNTEWHSIVEMATETLVVWSPRVYLCMNYRLLWLHGTNIVHQLAPFFFPLCAGKSSQHQDKQQQEQQKGNFSSVPLKSIWISSFQFYLLQETMATRLKDSYSQSDPRESLQIGVSLVVGFHLFIRIWAPPHLWNKCFVWCAGFNKLNIWPAHAHTHIHTHAHRNRKTHTHKQSTPTCTCGHRLTLMPDMVQSVSPSVWRCLYSAKTTLPQTHSCTHTCTHAHKDTRTPPPHTHTLWFFQTLISKSCSSCFLLYLPLLSSPILSSDIVHLPKASWHGDANGMAVARRCRERPKRASSRWEEGDPWMGCFHWRSSPAWE